ncbi:hypothetical protein AB3U99_19220 [Niallia sp. JL1B1071]|uniref:hypothetical protein n=1 Tax=Niallia tiangongensis TaxID=3237105 RepID=UPI0037DD607F
MSLLIGAILAYVYGILTSLSGMLQIKSKDIPTWSAYGMILFGIAICISSTLALMNIQVLTLQITCFVFISILAITNGFYLYRKINIIHHIIRLIITLFIIYLII